MRGSSVYTNQTNVGSIEQVASWSNTGGQCCDDPDHQVQTSTQANQSKKPNKKKGKNGAKLSHEEIKNLSTEELLSYIQNEGTGGMKPKNAQ